MWAINRRFPSSLRLLFSNSLNVPKANNSLCNCCRRKNDTFINCAANYSSFKKELYMETTSFCFVQDTVTDAGKRLELVKMEHQVMLEMGAKVPTEISDEDWLKLAEFKTYFRKRYYHYLFKADKSRKEKKLIKREQLLLQEDEEVGDHLRYGLFKKEDEEVGDHLRYGLFKNTIFYYISYTRMILIYNWLHLSAVTFGQIMVIDLDFDHLMSERDLKNAVFQIQLAYGLNKISKVPWNLYLCNAKIHSRLLKYLKFTIKNLETPNCLITVTEKSYLDIFPREKLVYLTGNSTKIMGDLDHDAIYIIGGFVDITHPTPASMSKAKKENLTALQLPLHKYPQWSGENKNLAINQVVGILIDLKVSGDWCTALKHLSPCKRGAYFYGIRPRLSYNAKMKSLFKD